MLNDLLGYKSAPVQRGSASCRKTKSAPGRITQPEVEERLHRGLQVTSIPPDAGKGTALNISRVRVAFSEERFARYLTSPTATSSLRGRCTSGASMSPLLSMCRSTPSRSRCETACSHGQAGCGPPLTQCFRDRGCEF